MVALPKAPDEKEEAIWDLTRRYLEVMINRELDFKFADNFWWTIDGDTFRSVRTVWAWESCRSGVEYTSRSPWGRSSACGVLHGARTSTSGIDNTLSTYNGHAHQWYKHMAAHTMDVTINLSLIAAPDLLPTPPLPPYLFRPHCLRILRWFSLRSQHALHRADSFVRETTASYYNNTSQHIINHPHSQEFYACLPLPFLPHSICIERQIALSPHLRKPLASAVLFWICFFLWLTFFFPRLAGCVFGRFWFCVFLVVCLQIAKFWICLFLRISRPGVFWFLLDSFFGLFL